MDNQKEITSYYNNLAKEYDQDRFANTYGSYIHKQEARFLTKHWNCENKHSLDLACGTGRWTHLTKIGSDISEEMLKVAQVKHPNKTFIKADGSHLPFVDNEIEGTLSFHLVMHLNEEKLITILNEVYRVTKPGGVFVFDFPSKARRNLLNKKRTNWHGSYGLTVPELKGLGGTNWELVKTRGILFLPIHRFPKFSRSFFMFVDNMMCASFLKKYSSYLIVSIRKK